MKKFLSVLCGILVALSLFVTTGYTAKAAEPTSPVVTADEGDCACHDVTPIEGKEKLVIVVKLIASKEFVTTLVNQLKDGYILNATQDIEVIKVNATGQIMVGVPFINKDRVHIMAVFMDGKFVGVSPQ